MGKFGWSLPPGCSMADIERAFGDAGPENCINCGADLAEDNDPQGHGVCSVECTWPAIAKMADIDRQEREADEAEAAWLAEQDTLGPIVY